MGFRVWGYFFSCMGLRKTSFSHNVEFGIYSEGVKVWGLDFGILGFDFRMTSRSPGTNCEGLGFGA